jgi:predicted RNase H-like nuclease (RuvC/YqgF family)
MDYNTSTHNNWIRNETPVYNTWISDNTTTAAPTWNTTTVPLNGINTNSGNLRVVGDAEIFGDLKLNGKSLTETLEKIEEKLAILRPNEDLESRWEELRNLRKAYMDLEKELINKEKVWETLKK